MAKTMQSGHKQIWIEGKGYKYEHRVVAERKLGRKLKPSEQIHHKDGNPGNNNAANLEVVDKAQHNKVDKKHHLGGRKKGK